MIIAQTAQQTGWSWSMLPLLLTAFGGMFGIARLLELFFTKRKGRGEAIKIEADAAAVISVELRQWATEANNRAKAAEERSLAIETRLQGRIDELLLKVAQAETKVNETREQLDKAEDQLERLIGRIMACQAGPVCPVRTADTDPKLRAVTPKEP